MRSALLVLALSFGAAAGIALPSPAAAHDIPDAKPRVKALHVAVTIEHETLEGFVQAIKRATDEYGVEWSAEATAAWQKGKQHHQIAKELHAKGQHRAAYAKLRDAHNAMKPAVSEVLGKKQAPPGFKEAIRTQISRSSEWIAVLAEHVEQPTGLAQEHWRTGKALYAEAKQLHKAGDNKAAFIKWHEALRSFDKAIIANWPDETGAAPAPRKGSPRGGRR